MPSRERAVRRTQRDTLVRKVVGVPSPSMIRCPVCATESPADNKFCRECGSALAGTCASCGTANPPDHKFCRECGKALSATTSPAQPASGAPSRAGRRLVSVLFADLVGFTTFSEGRDPEDVRTMLTGYFDRAREIVNRFGGSVDKFIGDAVMAVWGATEAHEDDAERAVRAALELVDAVTGWGAEIGAPDLRLRAGVNTGETSVGPGGNDKGLVVGDLVNTASRLQSLAEPGTVVAGETTRDLVAEAVLFESLGDLKVKGKQQPVTAYRALRVIAERGGRNRSDTVEPPFVGRDDELRLLKDQLHATGREGRARMVSVIGEAGIGKSRPRLGVAEVHRRHHRERLLAPRSIPLLRRRAHVLGIGRDGALQGWHRGDGRRSEEPYETAHCRRRIRAGRG